MSCFKNAYLLTFAESDSHCTAYVYVKSAHCSILALYFRVQSVAFNNNNNNKYYYYGNYYW
jgi:hypothetical protein